MYYTRQQAIDDENIPVSSNEDIDTLVFERFNGTSENVFFKDFTILGANEVEKRFDDLFFPSKQDLEDFMNEQS